MCLERELLHLFILVLVAVVAVPRLGGRGLGSADTVAASIRGMSSPHSWVSCTTCRASCSSCAWPRTCHTRQYSESLKTTSFLGKMAISPFKLNHNTNVVGVFWKIQDFCYNMGTEIFKIEKEMIEKIKPKVGNNGNPVISS